jgi:hypothetical protein
MFYEVVMFNSMRAKAKIAEDFKTFDNSQLNYIVSCPHCLITDNNSKTNIIII